MMTDTIRLVKEDGEKPRARRFVRPGLPVWRTARPAALGVAVVAAAMYGLFTSRQDSLYQGQVFLCYCLVVVGLTFAMSTAGEFFLGVGAVFVVGAYSAALCTYHGWGNFIVAIAFGVVCGLIAGLLVGLAALRVGGWYFGLATYFLVAIMPDVLNAFSSVTGGDSGLFPIPDPRVGSIVFGLRGRYLIALAAVALVLVVLSNLRASPQGSLLSIMRERRLAAAGAGVSPLKLRVLTYVACSIPAAIGGTIFGYSLNFLSPGQFPVSQSVLFFSAVILGGGSTSFLGPIVALGILYFVPQSLLDVQTSGEYVVGGVTILAAVIRSRDWTIWSRRLRGYVARISRIVQGGDTVRAEFAAGIVRDPNVAELVGLISRHRREAAAGALSASGIQVRFGKLAALSFGSDQVISVELGSVHTVLGPNGSGKTTLLNALCGFVPAVAGEVRLGNLNLSRLSPSKRAQLGVSRSWQTAVLPSELTPYQLVRDRLAWRTRLHATAWLARTPKARSIRSRSGAMAEALLRAAGLENVAHETCGSLDSTARRLVDVLLACVSHGSWILLDEPAAGLSKSERQFLGELITGLAGSGFGVMLVEHDLDLAIGLAHTVTVLDRGVPIFSGAPSAARTDDRVSQAFLGAAR